MNSAVNLRLGRRVRVALVTPPLIEGGGVASLARFIIHTLSNTDVYSVDLLCPSVSSDDQLSLRLLNPRSWRHGPRAAAGVSNGISYRQFGAWGSEIELFRYLPRPSLTSCLNEYDLVQVVSGSPALAYVARHYEGPLVIQFATTVAQERRAMLDGQLSRLKRFRLRQMMNLVSLVERRALALANVVFVLNSSMLDLVRRTSVAKAELLLPGVDTELFHPLSRNSPDTGAIVSVGRLNDPRKNISLLLRSYAELRSRRPDAPPLLLMGQSPPSGADLSLANDLGIEGSLHVMLEVSPETLASELRKAAVFVLPSDEEGLGVVLLEAMASGLPVIATDTAGATTVVENGVNGFIVPRGDVHQLSASLETILYDVETRREIAQRNREKALELFERARCGRRLVDVYDELLSNAGSA